ncbi:hypothetical protein [Parafrigoribacterium mesophilum]|uniref:hypothetical protein n=1 Tax=Parafrigoribacterium mesophilum TaxID=433646 RepID=UPI0031FC7AF8
MNQRRTPAQRSPSAFGVGAQVIVHLDRTDGRGFLQEDPVGVIIAPGRTLGETPYAPPTADDPSWIVEFEQPFTGLDGSGPHSSAKVPERLLELAPVQ